MVYKIDRQDHVYTLTYYILVCILHTLIIPIGQDYDPLSHRQSSTPSDMLYIYISLGEIKK